MKKLHFFGPVLTASGYGVHARQLLKALVESKQFDIAVESVRWGETPFLSDDDLEWIRKLASKKHSNPDVSIQVTIPNEFSRKAPLTIGVTAGIEVDRVSPQWLAKCNSDVDVVIVPSEHSRTAFMVEYQGPNGEKLRLEKPILVIHEGVDTNVFTKNEELSTVVDQLNLTTTRNFIFTGLGLDKPNGADRKNVTRLVEYFCRAFANDKSVGLILKTSIVNYSTLDFETVKKRVGDIKAAVGCGEYPKIYILHGRLSDSELASLYNDPRVTAAVSLTHGEGFGLPLIEAAACALPVMATNWSGHLDFLRKDSKNLFVPFAYDLTQIPDESAWDGVMERGTRWATVKQEDVIVKMQKMAASSDTPRKWAEELALHIKNNFSLEKTGHAFVSIVNQACAELDSILPAKSTDSLAKLKSEVESKGLAFVYTMPMSAGDVFLSTAVIKALKDKYPNRRVYFATLTQFSNILNGITEIDEVIEWQPWMQDPTALEYVFGLAFTPNLNVQMQSANWVHSGTGRNLINEFASQCGIDHLEYLPILPFNSEISLESKVVAVHSGGQKSARVWAHWKKLVRNIRENGFKVIQVGAKDDVDVGQVDDDQRGKTDHIGLIKVLEQCSTLIGIDSYPMHVASVLGLNVISIFGSSYASSTGPSELVQVTTKAKIALVETKSRNGCERACYKDQCAVDTSNPCINNIKAEDVFAKLTSAKFVDYRPKIAGYTHILNPKTHGYPYIQSIMSMMDFCDEVIVIDGGSTDGSIEELNNKVEKWLADSSHESAVNSSCKLQVITREWDKDEPGMDGMQKAFGRAMVSPDVDFLWQQDADEVVHEDDYQKIIDICERFPADVDLIHLPVVELWGDKEHARTDRHSWKWRLSRNKMRITHGIATQARVMDPKIGRIYAKEGMSDGCEMIDMVTGEHLQHRGFYSKELENIRVTDVDRYAQIMNDVYSKLPSVWHFSWANLPRKIRNFRDFWDNQWNCLYQTQSKPRFPDVVTEEDVLRKAKEMKEQGGEHSQAKTFKLSKNPPASMKDWDCE